MQNQKRSKALFEGIFIPTAEGGMPAKQAVMKRGAITKENRWQ